MIDSYSFGRMEINGRQYSSDIIIYPNGRLEDNWWRDEGHRLSGKDIAGLIEAKPELIIVGTGASGLMKVDENLKEQLQDLGIRLIAKASKEAMDEVNKHWGDGRTGACFHLTC